MQSTESQIILAIAWLADNGIHFRTSINPADKATARALFDQPLPDELAAFYALADGQEEDGDDPDLWANFRVSPLATLLCDWELLTDMFATGLNTEDDEPPSVIADPGVQPLWWSRAWLPFLSNGAGDHGCVDLAPAPGGTLGQIILFRHDEPRRRLLAPSLSAFLGQIVDQPRPAGGSGQHP